MTPIKNLNSMEKYIALHKAHPLSVVVGSVLSNVTIP